MGKKLFLLSSLLLSTLIWAEYYSFETGEEIKKNDWILLDEILTKDKGGNVLGTAYKYCVITDIVDETKKTPSAYSNREEPHPLNAVGYVWFVLNGTPVQSFTTRFIFRDALTGRRDTTLPEGCELKLQIPEI